MAKVWIATMTEGEHSDTSVYFLGVFDTREEAEAAVDERYAERRRIDGWRGISPMLDWEREADESRRQGDEQAKCSGELASAAVTSIERGKRVEIGPY